MLSLGARASLPAYMNKSDYWGSLETPVLPGLTGIEIYFIKRARMPAFLRE